MAYERVKTILLAEDEPDILKITAFRLIKNGFTVLTANNGKSAYELAVKEVPNLILLDLGLPVINGYDVYWKLRGDERTRKIPIVIFTASGEKEKNKFEGEPDEIFDFISKPYEYTVLLEKIRKYLGTGDEL